MYMNRDRISRIFLQKQYGNFTTVSVPPQPVYGQHERAGTRARSKANPKHFLTHSGALRQLTRFSGSTHHIELWLPTHLAGCQYSTSHEPLLWHLCGVHTPWHGFKVQQEGSPRGLNHKSVSSALVLLVVVLPWYRSGWNLQMWSFSFL